MAWHWGIMGIQSNFQTSAGSLALCGSAYSYTGFKTDAPVNLLFVLTAANFSFVPRMEYGIEEKGGKKPHKLSDDAAVTQSFSH